MNKIPIIGIIGRTGAGKTTIASIFQTLGCAVIDGDVLAREVVTPGSPTLAALANAFGAEILCDNGSLNRKKLAKIAFSSEAQRLRLNQIMHPAIILLLKKNLSSLESQAPPAILIDAAALLESDFSLNCEHILLIDAPEEIRLQRILERDGISLAEAQQRISMQETLCLQPPATIPLTVIETTKHKGDLFIEVETFIKKMQLKSKNM